MIRGEGLGRVAREVAELARSRRVVVVHGAGPQTTELQKALGQSPHVVAGRRITDEAALGALTMALGAATTALCAALIGAGARPIGLSGASACTIRAHRRPPRVVSGGGPDPIDFGFVGDVDGFDHPLLDALDALGLLPVLACLGADAGGQLYNINADVVATRLAVALGATDLFLLTGVSAVLRDLADPTSRIERLSPDQARALIRDGVVSGGMIPKLDESLQAVALGVERVHLLSEGLARAAARPGSVGTVLEAVDSRQSTVDSS